MHRRSLEHGRKCPASNNNSSTIIRSRRRNVGSTAFSPSTLLSFCAMFAILCLGIQTRLYHGSIYSHGPFLSGSTQNDASLGSIHHQEVKKPLDRLEVPQENLEQSSNDGNDSKEVLEKLITIDSGIERSGEQDTKSMEDKRLFPPRIVYYNASFPGTGTSENLELPEFLESRKHNSSDSVNTEKGGGETQKTAQIEESTEGDAEDEDDEDSELAVEDKNALGNHEDDEINECVPLAEWQSSNPVNCNTIHEIDLLSSILNSGKPKKHHQSHRNLRPTNITSTKLHHESSRHPTWNETQLKFLGQGWFRAAWKLDRQPPRDVVYDETSDNGDGSETLILKMLRAERDFTAEFYELHRIDAVAMEQLTHSKFVLNVYGYCGQSALNEFASFRIPQLSSLEKFDRQLRGRESPKMNRMKLKLAISVATGVAHVHELPADMAGDHRPTMAHYDINPRNVAICKGGLPKLNDFNVAHFLKYNPKTNQTCGFDSRLHEPWWRAPEEVSLNNNGKLTHAVDIWSLGNLLFHILTTHSPRGKMKDYRIESVRAEVLEGKPPPLPHEYSESKDPAIVAFREAMALCFVKDPSGRASAREVSDLLMDAYVQMMEDEQAKENKKRH